jgi:hypothetical protein
VDSYNGNPITIEAQFTADATCRCENYPDPIGTQCYHIVYCNADKIKLFLDGDHDINYCIEQTMTSNQANVFAEYLLDGSDPTFKSCDCGTKAETPAKCATACDSYDVYTIALNQYDNAKADCDQQTGPVREACDLLLNTYKSARDAAEKTYTEALAKDMLDAGETTVCQPLLDCPGAKATRTPTHSPNTSSPKTSSSSRLSVFS